MDTGPRIVRPPTEIDPNTAAELDRLLADCDADDVCCVDFAEVVFCDSSGIRVLVQHGLRHLEAGGTLRLVDVSEKLQRLFTIAGVGQMFDLDPA